jgi:RNA polymerase sigma factor (sigma-70 family)
MSDLLVISRFKNNHMWRLMGERTAKECAELCGVSQHHYGRILNLQESPFDGEAYTEVAERIAAGLGEAPEDLFPRSLYALGKKLPKKFLREYDSERVLSLEDAQAQQLRRLESDNPLDHVLAEEKRERCRKLLQLVRPREERVLMMRFGFEGHEQTLEEVGQVFQINRERVRQIQKAAVTRFEKADAAWQRLLIRRRQERFAASHAELIEEEADDKAKFWERFFAKERKRLAIAFEIERRRRAEEERRRQLDAACAALATEQTKEERVRALTDEEKADRREAKERGWSLSEYLCYKVALKERNRRLNEAGAQYVQECRERRAVDLKRYLELLRQADEENPDAGRSDGADEAR